jgi:hypothetical protein
VFKPTQTVLRSDRRSCLLDRVIDRRLRVRVMHSIRQFLLRECIYIYSIGLSAGDQAGRNVQVWPTWKIVSSMSPLWMVALSSTSVKVVELALPTAFACACDAE